VIYSDAACPFYLKKKHLTRNNTDFNQNDFIFVHPMQDGMSNNSSSFSLKPGEEIYMALRKINSSLGISVAVSFYSVWHSFQFLNLKTWTMILLLNDF